MAHDQALNKVMQSLLKEDAALKRNPRNARHSWSAENLTLNLAAGSNPTPLLPQSRFQLFVGVELATQSMIAFDLRERSNALSTSSRSRGIKVTP